MKHKDGKQIPQQEKGSRIISLTILFVVLCGFSFYLGMIFCSEKDKIEAKDVARTALASSPKEPTVSPLQIKSFSFPECGTEFQDYTPCTDPKRWKRYGVHRLSFLERHCPPVYEKKECLIPPPDGYKPPIRWPKSRGQCWYRNVPYDWINKQKSNQNWLRKEGEKFTFPGGGTMFPRGVSHYVDLMQDLIPGLKDGTVRTAIDTGCGVASWGGDLLDRGILTLSLAPRDNHEAQVQFALERGIPAVLGVISTQRLPFPSSAFDMAHCSRCLIPWTEFGGIYLLEIHRILRPGGFWVLSGPPVNYKNRWRGWNTTIEEQRSDYEKLQSLLTSMCFKKYAQKGDIAVWQKLSDKTCYNRIAKNSEAYPPKCDDSIEPDSAWYTPLRPCVIPPSPKVEKSSLKSIPKWPERLHYTPERISDIHGGSASGLKHDDGKWKNRVKHYKKLVPALGTDKIRNVMDMNTVYGGFAASLMEDPVWVMNVVSSYGANTLPVVYDRGLIGTYHDWCEAFSTYPRTYDLLHLDGLFTAESHRCEMKYVMLEMDRILRPKGYVIIRESSYFMDAIATISKAMRWDCRKEETEYAVQKEKILVCQKRLWFSSNQTTR
ncbi:PREDICTED: probable methyltransferase PMT20 [Tarenaya hassleriana]|uniref:probable methyltransferase PMT20 n=1 Tax=Tarenaya hassleriana TaxID=28532 RepID=UPI00053C224C|nr:PREDICTED: probable methyltransferase PMT20 [Tarenaya hassleriana]XP_010538340.1 PREDICTED: probable methyltransferase PMT20 [Tarenaya hassleriana]XP_010538341.1 PREDICTED: probable methyltransferase PMT20 [Tarenaya hassleriana]XP_010538342.1 PREDICTED: probable methyltransferase PMT20 [Tarenaya hassleriana]XP_010538343.1 PREDICTED: probable methyltransferase PMT20 [Tarenaya hassleriana]XP_010538344.1 PREDICTED: probable methyltransferase PMT20 [Tarenaya hassleriana]XP_010538345.1 PREDICTE